MQEIWVLENEAIYVNWNFCCFFCCYAYYFILSLLCCVHNYTWTTNTRTTRTKWHHNNTKNEHKKIHVNWSFCCDSTCCSCSHYWVNLLLFICNSECTMRDQQQQNDTVAMCPPKVTGVWCQKAVLHKDSFTCNLLISFSAVGEVSHTF